VEDILKSKSDLAKDDKKNEETRSSSSAFDRRDLMKFGAGAVITTLAGPRGIAQASEAGAAKAVPPSARPPAADVKTTDDWKNVWTGPGYKNDAGRISGNGPMDNTSRQLISYATSFPESKLTAPVLTGLTNVMIDAMTALIAGFESEPGRIGARIGRTIRSDYESTIMGYGVVTSPEVAAFTNSAMIRHCDYNDGGPPGGHDSDIIPGMLAIGESLHASGTQVLTAITMAYEVVNSLSKASEGKIHGFDSMFDGIATALGVGKLLGLDEDRLANALSIAIVPHIPLNSAHIGSLSHWKGVHSAISVRDGIYAALLAREGMTGPSQPFEARGGLWGSVTGPLEELQLPISSDGRLIVEYHYYKHYPAERNAQPMLLETIPAIRQWTRIEDIESIEIDMGFTMWQEIADPPKWDPRNRETADHSLPYIVAAALTDGELYLNAFELKRILEDQSLRQLMQKITCRANPEYGRNRSRTTVRKKTGEELVKDVFQDRQTTSEEIVAKFKRVCAYKSVSEEQRDRVLATWSSLQNAKDIAEPIREMAKFGKPALL
jgi:2-methylcitrate dehydratase